MLALPGTIVLGIWVANLHPQFHPWHGWVIGAIVLRSVVTVALARSSARSDTAISLLWMEAEVVTKITVNEKVHSTQAASDTPLLYVLRDDLELRGPKFGCGLAQCGACAVLVDGKETRSCVTPISAVVGKSVTTLEGLSTWYAKQKRLAKKPALHPLQQAWIDEQVPQCGYCQSGMIIMAAELLSKNAKPSDQEIKKWMDPHLCRCATHNAIVRAIKRAAKAAA